MVTTTASKVREMLDSEAGQNIWPHDLLLWPEPFIAAISAISLSLSLRTFYGTSAYDSGSLRDPLCEKAVRI